MGFVRKNLGVDLTGGGAARAAERASRKQAKAGRNAAEMLREASAPFAQMGVDAGNLLSQFINDPSQTGQQILSDPFFRQLAQEQESDILSQRAALGLAGSGGTGDMLQRNLLSLGNQFMQQRFNNLFNTTQMGANAAIGSATGQGNILQNVANVEAAGMQARAQQQARLGGQFMQLGGAAIGAMTGNPFAAMMGGQIGGSLAPQPQPFNSTVSGVGSGFFGSGAIPSSLTSQNILGG